MVRLSCTLRHMKGMISLYMHAKFHYDQPINRGVISVITLKKFKRPFPQLKNINNSANNGPIKLPSVAYEGFGLALYAYKVALRWTH